MPKKDETLAEKQFAESRENLPDDVTEDESTGAPTMPADESYQAPEVPTSGDAYTNGESL